MDADLQEIDVPASLTSRGLALEVIAATDYPQKGLGRLSRVTAPEIWRVAHNVLQNMRVDLLVLDEVQNLCTCAGTHPVAVGAALKARLQNQAWPVSLVLAGDERFDAVLDADPHIRNRSRIVRFHPLAPSEDLPRLSEIVEDYVEFSGLTAGPCIRTRPFAERLMHSSERLLAKACEITVLSLSIALRARERTLTIHHFAEYYRQRTGCLDDQNVFLADRFFEIGRVPDRPRRNRKR